MPVSKDCEICRGRRVIRLPVYRSVSAVQPDMASIEHIDDDSREFPCPACAPAVPEDCIAIVEAGAQVLVRSDADPRHEQAIKADLAHALVHHLLSSGFIRFSRAPVPKFSAGYKSLCTEVFLRAEIAVAAPKAIGSIEDRVRERLLVVGHKIVNEAEKRMAVWGSAYGSTTLQKEQATDAVRDAVLAVIKQHDEEF
jgi:hypothetical protein